MMIRDEIVRARNSTRKILNNKRYSPMLFLAISLVTTSLVFSWGTELDSQLGAEIKLLPPLRLLKNVKLAFASRIQNVQHSNLCIVS